MKTQPSICRACGKELVRNHFIDKLCDKCYLKVYGEMRKTPTYCSYYNASSGICKKDSDNFICPFRKNMQASCKDYLTE